jgi:hypothetical protein
MSIALKPKDPKPQDLKPEVPQPEPPEAESPRPRRIPKWLLVLAVVISMMGIGYATYR